MNRPARLAGNKGDKGMKRNILSAAALALLAACGGGGGGGGASAPPPAAVTFNADAALASSLANGLNLSGLSGKDASGNTYSVAVSFSAGADAPFLGSTQKRSVQTVTVARNGVTAGTSSAQVFYSTAPATIIGTVDSSGLFTLYKPAGSLPAAGTVGQTGALATTTVFVGTTNSTVLGTGAVNWSVEADTASTALACLNTSATTATPTSVCLRINSAGAVQGGRVTLTVAGTAITAQ